MTAYHVNEHRETSNIAYAKGIGQWLGDGYYFWQDEEFALEWVKIKLQACEKVDFYTVNINFPLEKSDDDFLYDTVFNEEEYYSFVRTVEYFAEVYTRRYAKKPSLGDFNNFLLDQKIDYWKDLGAIRFQDTPKDGKRAYLKVSNFFYKKRIQIVLRNLEHVEIKKIVTYNRADFR
jgi:hypothetical protein